MAVDEALALMAPVSGFRPILRIYRWNRPAVSIGYNQDTCRGIDIEFCRAQGIDVVRRPTGGRAVYHHQELTYAVVVPRAFFKGDTILESYRTLAQGFLECLGILGVTGELITPAVRRKNSQVAGRKYPGKVGSGRRRKKADQPACFLAPSRYEIGVGGKKIIGSAQRRYRLSVLQQGSFLLAIDWKRFLYVFRRPEQEGVNGQNQVIGMEKALGRKVGFEEAAHAVIVGFEKAFAARMVEDDLNHQEQDMVKRLVREKYNSTEWNINRIDCSLTPTSETGYR